MSATIRDREVSDRVRRYYALVDSNDVDEIVSLFSDTGVYFRPGYEPIRGHMEIDRFYRTERVIVSGRHRISSLLVDGESVAVHGEFTGTVRTGRRVNLRFADFFEMDRRGRFSRRDTFFFAPMV